MIFGIGNEYPNFYADVYKLKSDLVGGYVKKRLTICELELGNRHETGVCLETNWYCLTHPKFMIFGLVIV